jgi:hypothetical protein
MPKQPGTRQSAVEAITDGDITNICANCREARPTRKTTSREPAIAWMQSCAKCASLWRAKPMKQVGRLKGNPRTLVMRCRRCGLLRTCQPGWNTRCHACLDKRSLTDLGRELTVRRPRLTPELMDYVTLFQDARDRLPVKIRTHGDIVLRSLGQEQGRGGIFRLFRKRGPVDPQVASAFVAAMIAEQRMDNHRHPDWEVLATDVKGLPWAHVTDHESHGTVGRHLPCGNYQKMTPSRECVKCPPDLTRRTDRAMYGRPYLLYLVEFGGLYKFGIGNGARVLTHRQQGADVVRVLRGEHQHVKAAETRLKRRFKDFPQPPAPPGMPRSFGTGATRTETVLISVNINLDEVLSEATDVTVRYKRR